MCNYGVIEVTNSTNDCLENRYRSNIYFFSLKNVARFPKKMGIFRFPVGLNTTRLILININMNTWKTPFTVMFFVALMEVFSLSIFVILLAEENNITMSELIKFKEI